MWYKKYIPLPFASISLSMMSLALPLTDIPEYSIPLYIQIADRLINQIEAGELSPGDRLPPERELSENLGINRMTLRRALRVLEAQGWVLRKHGVGTFIGEPKIDRPMDVLFRFTRGMQKRGLTPGAQVISLEQAPVTAAVGRDLTIPLSSPVYMILRLRSINQEPVMLESYTIPVQRFPRLDQYDLEKRSIYEVMEVEYGVGIVRARQSFEPVVASAFEAELLRVWVGAPLMLEQRISFDRDNRPVEYGKDRYRGDRFRFVTEAAPFDF
jgi:GntR family transcriptional regulator, N-acetylglucosamine utilization regulator